MVNSRLISRVATAALVLGTGSAALFAGPALAASPPVTVPRAAPIIYRGHGLSPTQAVPLLIGLHASGGTPAGFAATTGFEALADTKGFEVAFLGSPAPAWKDVPTNLAYVESEITQIEQSTAVDTSRVYVTGFSAGANMSLQVACQDSAQITAIAIASGWLPRSQPCQVTHPVSVLTITATNDIVPLAGTALTRSPLETTTLFEGLDNCAASTPAAALAGPVTEQLWSGCQNQGTIGLDIIAGGTHQWPGAPQATGVDTQFNATQAVWNFLSSTTPTSGAGNGAGGGTGTGSAPGTGTGTPIGDRTGPSRGITSVSHRHRGVLARLLRVTVRRDGRRHRVLAVFSLTESARVTSTLSKRNRKFAAKTQSMRLKSHLSMVLMVGARAKAGTYILRIKVRGTDGREVSLVKSVRVGA